MIKLLLGKEKLITSKLNRQEDESYQILKQIAAIDKTKNKNSTLGKETFNNEPLSHYSDYHIFKIRDSWLDLLIEKTKINQSEFKGFFNLIIVLFITYCFTLPFSNNYHKGYLFKLGLFNRMFKDLSILYTIWPLFHFWTYTAYLHELMILKKFPRFFTFVFNFICEYGILVFATYYCLYADLPTPPTIYTLVQALIHFFKMHSYTYTNRDYRENYLEFLEIKKTTNKMEDLNSFKSISSYPNNINFKNFFYFLLAPTLCYQENYPRSGKFRPVYLLLKILKAFFCLTLLYYIYSESLEDNLSHILETSLPVLIINTYFPITVFCLVCFYLIFECVLPGYAEISTFGDRQFYDDWWNSTDLTEFNRKWNKIVHMFLHRHIYVECRNRYKMSKITSTFMTFFISAVLHEYCLCILIKLFRPMMFVMMLSQIPLIIIGQKLFKNTTFGNLFFWFSNLLGVCLIFIIYNREYFTYYGGRHA